MKEKKHPCHTMLFALRWLISRPQVSKSNSWKNISFSKTMALQREPFLIVDQPKFKKCSRKKTRHSLLMAGIHARCMDHGLGKTIRVDAQLVFEF